MDRSRSDRLISRWDRLTSNVRRPEPRTAMASSLPASALAGLIVVVLGGIGVWLATGAARQSTAWGPLAVAPPSVTMMEARNVGTLHVDAACVYLERKNGDRELLVWPADRTVWDPANRAISLRNQNGAALTMRDGDFVEIGGGRPGADVSAADYATNANWEAPPAASCLIGGVWIVGEFGTSPESRHVRLRA